MDLQLLLFIFVLVSASESSSIGNGIPGPPIGLNWTTLNTSSTGTYVDIQVTWKPPPSAHIQNGWVSYQLQYKEVNETKWRKLDAKEATTVQLKNLMTCHDYELRVRTKQASGIYGEFSDVQYVSLDSTDLVPCEEDSSQRPYIISCRSPEMETFSCYWSTGNFPHLTTPETMQLLYVKSQGEWKECHDYVTGGENSCYFNKTYTSIWTPYCIKLVSGNQHYDEECFRVEDIVIPDPPIGLNWSVLNSSPTGIRMDIQVTWKPPPSADVRNGWVTLSYQLQYKGVNETKWNELDLKDVTTVPLYALKTCQDYEIRVRAKAVSEVYGEFSDVLYVSFGSKGLVPCEEEFHVHWPLVMVIGILGLMVMLSVVLFSKQQKLKILILPPVPVPKIKGIDPDLFKKISELRGKNNLLNLQLDKTNRLLAISQSKEESAKEDENKKLQNAVHVSEEKLKSYEQEHKNAIERLMREIEIKEEDYIREKRKLHSDMNIKF